MKWLRVVAKCVSKLNNNGKLKLNRAGLSLIELVVTLGVTSIILLGAGSLLVFVSDAFIKILDKDEAETSLTRAAYTLRTIATQAVNLQAVDISNPNLDVIGGGGGGGGAIVIGQIALALDTTTHPQVNNPGGNVAHRSRMIEIAAFFREAAFTGNSNYVPTAIYFKTPWYRCAPNVQDAEDAFFGATRENCSGQLIIVSNNQGGLTLGNFDNNGTANNQLYVPNANNSFQLFDRFTSISVQTTAIAGASYARDTRMTLTARYFLGGNPTQYNYMAGNIAGGYPKDISMEIYIGFRNNFLGRSQLVSNEPERLHGSLYYFPFVTSLTGLN